MPSLPLPPLTDGVCLDGGDLPVSSITDVANEWAYEIQSVPVAPIRDAIEAGQVGMFLEYQRRSSYAAAQSDPGRATDEYLDEILEEHGCPRQEGQSDTAARTAMFETQPVVSPDNIITVANSILAPYTSVSCRYAERSDGWFVGTDNSWSSHVFSTQFSGFQAASPNYPDRPNVQVTLSGGGGSGATATATVSNGAVVGVSVTAAGAGYTSAPTATVSSVYGGVGVVLRAFISGGAVTLVQVISQGTGYVQSRRPPGAMPNVDTYGRWFLLRTQDISSLDTKLTAAFNGLQNEPSPAVGAPGVVENVGSVGGFYVGSGTTITDDNVAYIFNFAATTVNNIYNELIAAVDAAVGSGIRWDISVEQLLAT